MHIQSLEYLIKIMHSWCDNDNIKYNDDPEAFRRVLDALDDCKAALKQISEGRVAPSTIKGYVDEAYQQIAREALEKHFGQERTTSEIRIRNPQRRKL